MNKTFNITDIKFSGEKLVVFLGPSGCGKSSALIRFIRYLRQLNIDVVINREFRSDPNYEEVIQRFEEAISDPDYSANSTPVDDYLLVDIKDSRGNILFQILETPGEAFFSKANPEQMNRPIYLAKILTSHHLKTLFVPFLDHDILEASFRSGAPDKKNNIKNYLKNLNNHLVATNLDPKKDKVLFLQNKIDVEFGKNGVDNAKQFEYLNNRYPAFQTLIQDLTKQGVEYDFISFSSGLFSPNPSGSGRFIWIESNKSYPEELTDKIRYSFAKKIIWPKSVQWVMNLF